MRRVVLTVSALLLLPLATPAFGQTANPLPYVGQTNGAIAPLDLPLPAAGQPQFAVPLPVPVDYTPTKIGGGVSGTTAFDYYELQYAQVTGTSPFSSVGAPDTTQWLGLCVPGTFNKVTQTCGTKAYTPVWGFGPVAAGGGPLGAVATYPSMNIRATKGTPVKVRWVNNLPDQHLFCQDPTNANAPCAIDRTLMGTKVGTGVTTFGGSQQPDNAVVVHLHGGDIPPEADGFAELWFGNKNTMNAYPLAISPALSYFNPPPGMASLALNRPAGDSAIYNYPMNQEAAMIWFHDHALGKTRINVAAGPAGFFQINDPAVEGALAIPKGGAPYEINVALQDRAFNAPVSKALARTNAGVKGAPVTYANIATINYPNGMNWLLAAPLACTVPPPPPGETAWTTTPAGTAVTPNALTPGVNPCIHPQWVPEYFGDVSIVNGMAWPFLNVEPRVYRIHFLDGSNARCWSIRRNDAMPIHVIGTEQGYLTAPAPVTQLTMCPGERYDTLLDFTGLAPGTVVNLLNNASAPFPKGVNPTGQDVGRVLQFRVNLPLNTAVPNQGIPLALVPAAMNAPLMGVGAVPCTFNTAVGGAGLHTGTPAGCVPMRQKVLNEVLDPVTLFPLRVQIDGKAFEDPITETPKVGSIEVWKIVNTTVDAHPIHTHLVRHQIVSRQKFDTAGFAKATGFATPGVTTYNPNFDVTPFLNGGVKAAAAFEAGWKDTSISYPGEVLTLVAKWEGHWSTTALDEPLTQIGTDPAGLPIYKTAFLPATSGPYVWHCHIVDHEDNEMMRPVVLSP